MANLKLFLSYSHKDKMLKESFFPYLEVLGRKCSFSIWVDSEITAGSRWEPSIMNNLESSQIILLFLSIDFLNSNFCTTREMVAALRLHEKGSALIIPIIVRPLPTNDDYPFNPIQALPLPAPSGPNQGVRAVTAWPDQDLAWGNVCDGISAALDKAIYSLTNLEHCNIAFRIQRVEDAVVQGDIIKALDMLIDYCAQFSPANPTNRRKAVAYKGRYVSLRNENKDDGQEREEIILNILELLDAVRVEPLHQPI